MDYIPFPKSWLRKLGCPMNALQVIEARGDSMEPDISDGDVLLVDTSATGAERDGLYVLRYGSYPRVKYLQRRADGSILIRSRAPEEADEEVPRQRLDDLAVIGRVVWHGHSI